MSVAVPGGTDRPPAFDRHLAALADGLAATGRRPVLVGARGTMTGAGFLRSVSGFAAALRAEGAGPGRAVAILTGADRFETITARHAAHRIGAPVVHLRSANARSDNGELEAVVRERVLRTVVAGVGGAVLVADPGTREAAAALAAAVPGVTVVDVGAAATGGAGVGEPWAWHPDETVAVDLTSGSTGMPKMVRHGAAGRAAFIAHSAGPGGHDYRPTLLVITPVSHAVATMIDAVLLAAGTVVLAPDAGPDAVLDAVAAHRVTDLYLPVPTLYGCTARLLGAPDPLPSLRRVVYSGTAASPARIAMATAAFGDRLAQLYGSTEAGGITSLGPADHREPELLASVGRPFPWVRTRVCEPDTARPVPRGTEGEIHVRSPTLMQGYLGEPASDVRLLADGWLHTGDVGRVDRYGYLHLTGRLGDVVKCGGIKIHPAEVARVVGEHPAVADATAFGVRDHGRQDELVAAVELRPGARCRPGELETLVARRLSPEHVPTRTMVLVALPRTATGKPDVARLRATRP